MAVDAASLPTVVVEHASGAKAIVHLFGANLTSYKPAAGQELLFVSERSAWDGEHPIRGGVPLVFPVFGPSPAGSSMPNHGFARIRNWTCDSNEGGVAVFSLTDDDATRALWPHAFRLQYTVTVQPASVQCDLAVTNASDAAPMPCQALLHTYYGHQGLDGVRVTGLSGLAYKDKVAGGALTEDTAPAVDITAETDRVYHNVPGVLELTGAGATGDRCTLRITPKVVAEPSADGVVVPVDTVVWNPWVDKSKRMADFGDDEFHRMICVEPGMLSAEVAPSATTTLSQLIEVV